MEDMKLFDAYRKQNTETGCSYCDVDYLLRLWRENKSQYLTQLFDDKLILEKEVEYQKNVDELHSEMSHMLHEQFSFRRQFARALHNHLVTPIDDTINNVLSALENCLDNTSQMVDNYLSLGCRRVDNGTWYDYEEIKSCTLEFDNGRKIQLQLGMKATRAMTQLCNQIGLENEWEQFRIKHSQILNQKKLKGTLCLSIHPLDYATASDNDNGWSSCMSWREEGCYRMGTVEMMNSPMVICAYLKSNKQSMSIVDDNDWNSKKWRAWIIVNKDVILCNRHYPYHQENFAIQAIDWVKELVGAKYGWKYEETHVDFFNHMEQTKREVEFRTNYMYNDLGGDDVIGCFRLNAKMSNLPGYINFSGPAECMVCGNIIPYDVQGADTLMCCDCDSHSICCRCGSEVDDDYIYEGPDGNTYCEECYNDLFIECEECGCIHDRENDDVSAVIPIMSEAFNDWVEKYHTKVDARGNKVFDPGVPGYDLWRRMHWNPETTEETHFCSECAERKGLVKYTDKNGFEWMVPDPTKHTLESAASICRMDSYNWAAMLKDVSWASDEDIKNAEAIKAFWKANWEVFTADFVRGK